MTELTPHQQKILRALAPAPRRILTVLIEANTALSTRALRKELKARGIVRSNKEIHAHVRKLVELGHVRAEGTYMARVYRAVEEKAK